jgi:hypothetical protein
MSEQPSERALMKVERQLRKLSRGKQRAVGGGVYMRLDSDGRRRFQFRLRDSLGQPGGTYDSWVEADEKRREATRELSVRRQLGEDAGPLRFELRRMPLRVFADEWWETIDGPASSYRVLTVRDYGRSLARDVLPLIGHFTLEQLEMTPLLVDRFKEKLVAHTAYPVGHPREGGFPRATCDHAITVASSICQHALRRGIISRNPFQGIARFGQEGAPHRDGRRSNYRRVKPTEVMHPNTVARAASGIRGTWKQIEERRGAVELLGFGGLRPSEICAATHSWWRDANGPRRYISVTSAIKDVAGLLEEEPPKTGARDVYLFDALAWQLERIYQAQGCPPLDSLICPNRRGTFQDWGNWRDDYWYQALHRAALAERVAATATGAFDPYILRHILAGAMTHAVRPAEWGGGTYSRAEVARQLGHSVQTLDRVYADIPGDLHGIAGMTMDEMIRAARRQIWGALPGDLDFEDELLTLYEAERITGISHRNLCARIYRGSLPGRDRGARKVISRFDLRWCGLIGN